MIRTRLATLAFIFSVSSLTAWGQSPPLLQPGTYNAPAGTGAYVPTAPAVSLPSALSSPPRQGATFNQDILNLNQGNATQQLWLREQAGRRSEQGATPPGKTLIRVKMPTADAQLWVNGQLTRQKGLERTFVTPPLEWGNYRYNFKAVWDESNKPKEEDQSVVFPPATEVAVDFTAKHPTTP